ncbi:MAG: large repetitive protein, partial [Thermoplasmata archaeon]|nr:large repetitive protein [Thermoplasmata archaeon]
MTSRAFASFAALTILASLLALPPAAAVAPSVTAVTPNTGPSNGGTVVNITGAHFDKAAIVQFVDVPATGAQTLTASNIVVDGSGSTIRFTTPVHPGAGAVNIIVKNPDGTQSTSSNGFTYLTSSSPSAGTVSPSSGTANGNDVLVLTGTGFSTAVPPRVVIGGTVSGNTISNGAPATVLPGTLTSTRLSILVPGRGALPASSTNTFSIALQNPDGSTPAQFGNAYTYLAQSPPTLKSVSPLSGSDNGGTTLTIEGTGFAPGAQVLFRSTTPAASAPAASVVYVSPTQINVVTPAVTDAGANCLATSSCLPTTAGAIEVVVTNPDGKSTAQQGVTYTFNNDGAPAIGSYAPHGGPSIGGTTVTLSGSGFANGPKLAVVFGPLPGVPGTNVKWTSSSQLSVVTPACVGASCDSASVPVDVHVVNPDGKASAAATFTYSPSVRIDSIRATGGAATSTLTVGTDGVPAAGGPTVELVGAGFPTSCRVLVSSAPTVAPQEAPGTPVCGSTLVRFTAPPGAIGVKDVTVVGVGSDGRGATLQGGLGYVAAPLPAIDSLSVTTATGNAASASGKVSTTITGHGFIVVRDPLTNKVVWPVVTFGSAVATITGSPSSTSIDVLVPPNTSVPTPAGLTVNVKVTNLDGQGTAATTASSFKYTKEANVPVVVSTCTKPTQAAPSTDCPSAPATGVANTLGAVPFTLDGQHFVVGSRVLFGTVESVADVPCPAQPTVTCLVSDEHIKVFAPPASSGAAANAKITVKNPDGQASPAQPTLSEFTFVYTATLAPQVGTIPTTINGVGDQVTVPILRQPLVWGDKVQVTIDTTRIVACSPVLTATCIVKEGCSATVTNY